MGYFLGFPLATVFLACWHNLTYALLTLVPIAGGQGAGAVREDLPGAPQAARGQGARPPAGVARRSQVGGRARRRHGAAAGAGKFKRT